MKTKAIAVVTAVRLAVSLALGVGFVVAGAAPAHAAKRVGILGGIGAYARGDAGGFRIVKIVPDGPAARSGIKPGDIIQTVDGMPTAALSDGDVCALIRGTAGTTVELDVTDKNGNHSRKLRLIRVAGALVEPAEVLLPPPAPVAAPPSPDPNPAFDRFFRNAESADPPRVGGIGALIMKVRGALRVVKALPNGPAARAGIQPKEIIQAINGKPTATMVDMDAADLMQGPVGTTVELEVSDENGGHWRKVRLVRATIDTAVAAQAAAPGGNLTSVQYQNMQRNREGTIGGIGAMLHKDGGGLRVRETVANGPAARAGLRPGAIIQTINGAPTATLTEADAGKLLRGPAGTAVDLDVSDEGAPNWYKVHLVRGDVAIGVYYRMLDRGIGLLTITGFTNQTPTNVREALEVLARTGARALVIDLRDSNLAENVNNGADVAGFFVGKAVPIWLERKLGESKATPVQSSQQKIWSEPVVVLVNAGTTQSSVLLASALRSTGRAWVVGRKTASASQAQSFEKRDDGSARRVALTRFFSLRDEPLSLEGITPDVPLDACVAAQDEVARAAAVFEPPAARSDTTGVH